MIATVLKWLSKKPKITTQEVHMQLYDLFKKEVALMQSCKVSAQVINLLNELTPDTLKDEGSRNQAIDAIVELLVAEKKA